MKQRCSIPVFAASLFLCLLLAACQHKSIDYQPVSEIPAGPGLFSGEDGEFNLYYDRRQTEAMNQKEPAVEQGTTAQQVPSASDQQDYQSFKQWQAGQRQADDAEYQEFKAWQEWKAMQRQ